MLVAGKSAEGAYGTRIYPEFFIVIEGFSSGRMVTTRSALARFWRFARAVSHPQGGNSAGVQVDVPHRPILLSPPHPLSLMTPSNERFSFLPVVLFYRGCFFFPFSGARVGEQGRRADHLEPDIGTHRQHEVDVAREAHRAAGCQLPKGDMLKL